MLGTPAVMTSILLVYASPQAVKPIGALKYWYLPNSVMNWWLHLTPVALVGDLILTRPHAVHDYPVYGTGAGPRRYPLSPLLSRSRIQRPHTSAVCLSYRLCHVESLFSRLHNNKLLCHFAPSCSGVRIHTETNSRDSTITNEFNQDSQKTKI